MSEPRYPRFLGLTGLVLVFASLFLMSCGQHDWDDFFGMSSSSELLSSSSVVRSDSSSSRGSSSSAVGTRLNGEYATADGRTIKLYYSFPPSVNDETKVLIVLPGSGRSVSQYVNQIYPLSENVIVLGLIFSSSEFPTSAQYDFANMYNSGITPYSEWTFHYIDAIFEQFVAQHGLSARKYVLYGWSAGSSLATRAYMFSTSPYLDYVITGGMSSPIYLDEASNYGNSMTARKGIKDLLQYKDIILDNLANRKLYVLIGRDDERYERAIDFYEYDKSYARQNYNIDLKWELTAVEGVGHETTAPFAPLVWNIIATGNASSDGRLSPGGISNPSYVSPLSDKGNSIGNYETVVINGKRWMAENLNYAVPGSRCYGEGNSSFATAAVQANCDKYGRLYDWETAKTVCPSGWHIPSDDEWREFINSVDGKGGSAIGTSASLTAGKDLKAKDAWDGCASSSCADTHGFAAFPGGFGYDFGNRFSGISRVGYWWSATGLNANSAYYLSMVIRNQDAFRYYDDKQYLFSVRCAEN